MKRELVVKVCERCNGMVKSIKDSRIICCGDSMEELIPNSVDAAVEKHVPEYERVEDEIFVKVNHVMEKEHFIEWITLLTDDREETVTLYPEQNAQVRFKYIPGSTIYAYCNKHGLWKKDVE